jgi:hypothetical protein
MLGYVTSLVGEFLFLTGLDFNVKSIKDGDYYSHTF